MHRDVLTFWFDEIDPKQWWSRDDVLDRRIAERFADIHARATRCELYDWRATAAGRLAEIIVLDQFSRNMFRNSPLAFAWDPLALALAQEAVAAGADQELTPVRRSFLYMPYMHSESPLIHQLAVALFSQDGLEYNLDFELKHKWIIDQFGRYPHRNRILGRTSTDQELEFLKQPGAGF